MLIDGKKIQKEIKEKLKEQISNCKQKPSLGIVLVGEDPASEKFVSLKKRFGEDIGVLVWMKILPETATTESIISSIESLETDGVVVQLPLPGHVDQQAILNAIPKEKDIDALHGGDFVAPVSGAVFEILSREKIDLEDKSIVLVGLGKLVGEPISIELKKQNIPFEVITLETGDGERQKILKEADIVISGVGNPHMIKPDMIKEGVVLIDAGTSESAGILVGDIDPTCREKAGLLTPVPGGVGPITVAILFRNLITKCLS